MCTDFTNKAVTAFPKYRINCEYRNYKECDATSFLKDLDLNEMIKAKMYVQKNIDMSSPFLEVLESVLHKRVLGEIKGFI